MLASLAQELKKRWGTVDVLPPKVYPMRGYIASRDQWLAAAFLEDLRTATAGRVLGVVDVDLYAEGLNFVFGQAELGGRTAVISLKRLFAKPQILLERALKEAIHELGHTFGLQHCKDRLCVMHFSSSLGDTDLKSTEYCESCATSLRASVALPRR